MKIELSDEELGHILECLRGHTNTESHKDAHLFIIDKIKQFLIDNKEGK